MELKTVVENLNKAKISGLYGFIEVTIPGQNQTEFIINKPGSIANKIEYYKNTYDGSGIHKHCKDIRIINAGQIEFEGGKLK